MMETPKQLPPFVYQGRPFPATLGTSALTMEAAPSLVSAFQPSSMPMREEYRPDNSLWMWILFAVRLLGKACYKVVGPPYKACLLRYRWFRLLCHDGTLGQAIKLLALSVLGSCMVLGILAVVILHRVH